MRTNSFKKNVKKFALIILILILTILNLSSMQAGKRNIVDMAKNNVTIPEKIERVITLDPFSTQIMIGLNLKDLLVDAQYGTSLIGEGFAKVVPDFSKWGKAFSGNSVIIENIVEKKPDLVISQIGRPDLNKIMELKIPVIQIDVENDQAFIGALNLIGEIFNRKQRAAEISKFISTKLNEFYTANTKIKDLQKPKIYIAGSNILRTFGNLSFQYWLTNLAGGVLVTENYKQMKVDINPETLIKLNPDYIILSKYTSESIEQILNDGRFSSINAIKNKKIYRFPSFVVSWDLPSFEMIAGIAYIRYLIGIMSLGEFKSIINDLYKTVYSINLIDEEIDNFLICK